MNVSLTAELETWIQDRVASGLYRSSSEVVREAVRLLREQEALKEIQRDALRNSVQAGLADLDAGHALPLDGSLLDSIKANGRRRAATGA